VYPWTQRYFRTFGNLYSAQTILANPLIAKHGTKILHGLDRAVKNMDDIKNTYAELSELHSEKLHVDPDNFRVSRNIPNSLLTFATLSIFGDLNLSSPSALQLLADCMTVTIAATMGNRFTIEIQAAWTKFMAVVVSALGRQYH